MGTVVLAVTVKLLVANFCIPVQQYVQLQWQHHVKTQPWHHQHVILDQISNLELLYYVNDSLPILCGCLPNSSIFRDKPLLSRSKTATKLRICPSVLCGVHHQKLFVDMGSPVLSLGACSCTLSLVVEIVHKVQHVRTVTANSCIQHPEQSRAYQLLQQKAVL